MLFSLQQATNKECENLITLLLCCLEEQESWRKTPEKNPFDDALYYRMWTLFSEKKAHSPELRQSVLTIWFEVEPVHRKLLGFSEVENESPLFFSPEQDSFLVDKLFELKEEHRIKKFLTYSSSIKKFLRDRTSLAGREEILTFYFDCLKDLLEQPVEQPFEESLFSRRVDYFFGVDVHEKERDAATIKGWKLLVERTGTVLGWEETENAVDSFVAYCREQPNPDKSAVLAALFAEYTVKTPFGGLLNPIENHVVVYGERICSKELMARIWLFAESYAKKNAFVEEYHKRGLSEETLEEYCARRSKREIEWAKSDMFRALKHSYDSSGQLVCDPGKIQRLFVYVLQGRLEGVVIDDEAKELPVDQLVSQFYLKKSVQDLYLQYEEAKAEEDFLQAEHLKANFLQEAALYCAEGTALSEVTKEAILDRIRAALDLHGSSKV